MSNLITESRNGYLVVSMNRGSANALEQTLIDELRELFRSSTLDDSVNGIILTGKERFFSVGLDLITLYDYDEEQIAYFWKSFMSLIHNMVAWPKPLVAAISGHAPAGGCLLALTADYRVMADGDFNIGLNEVPVGIIVPEAIFNLYRFWIGQNLAHTYLLEGKQVKPAQAQACGMIHEVASADKVLANAERQMQRYMALPKVTWVRTKTNLRRQLLQDLQMDFEEVFAPALKLWWVPNNRALIKMMVDGLKAKSKS